MENKIEGASGTRAVSVLGDDKIDSFFHPLTPMGFQFHRIHGIVLCYGLAQAVQPLIAALFVREEKPL